MTVLQLEVTILSFAGLRNRVLILLNHNFVALFAEVGWVSIFPAQPLGVRAAVPTFVENVFFRMDFALFQYCFLVSASTDIALI